MAIKERFFLIGDQWTVIHFPNMPNGFAIILIGDADQYVHSDTSSWHQHYSKNNFIEQLNNAGYTVVQSNMYGRHWGSDSACQFLFRLYDEIMKREILNRKVHIISVGMGALVAAKTLPKLKKICRSITMIDPCLNLKTYFIKERNNKLFFKRIVNEMKKAYHLTEDELFHLVDNMDIQHYQFEKIPIKILHRIYKTPYSLEDHARPYEQLLRSKSTPLQLAIFENSKPIDQLAKPVLNFIKKYDIPL